MVYKAYTDPEMLSYWWGPADMKVTVEKLELEIGGAWRFMATAPSGQEYAFHGQFLQIIPNQKLQWILEFEMMPGHITTETVVFEDMDDKTKVTTTTLYHSIEDRDGMIQTGIEKGFTAAMERLAKLVVKKQEGDNE